MCDRKGNSGWKAEPDFRSYTDTVVDRDGNFGLTGTGIEIFWPGLGLAGTATGIGDRDCSTKRAIVKLMQVLVLAFIVTQGSSQPLDS